MTEITLMTSKTSPHSYSCIMPLITAIVPQEHCPSLAVKTSDFVLPVICHACDNTHGAVRVTGNNFCPYTVCTVAPLMGKLSRCAQEKTQIARRMPFSPRGRKSQCKGKGRSRSASEPLGIAVNRIEPATRAKEKCTDHGNESAGTAQNCHQ